MRAFGLENGLRIAGGPDCDPFLPACSLLLQSGLRAGGCLSKGSCDRREPLQKKEDEKEKDAASRVKNKCRR